MANGDKERGRADAALRKALGCAHGAGPDGAKVSMALAHGFAAVVHELRAIHLDTIDDDQQERS